MGAIYKRMLSLLVTTMMICLAATQNATPGVVYNSGTQTNVSSQYYKNTLVVIKFLCTHNPPDGFATSVGYGEIPNIAYGHSRCYNLSVQADCGDCLQQAFATIQQVVPLDRAAALLINESDSRRCFLRYDSNNLTTTFSSQLGVLGPNASTPTASGPKALSSPAPAPNLKHIPAPVSNSRQSSKSRKLVVGGLTGGGALLALLAAGLLVWRLRSKRLGRFHGNLKNRADLDPECPSVESPVVFKYRELCAATGNFSDERKLGRGGFGAVYKGFLDDGATVAVKKLSLESHQGRMEFVNEINVITGIKHKNLVRLKGYCVEGDERLVVYEFLENGSLHQALFGSETYTRLSWEIRFQIALGVARGLAYLHEESPVQIIHRDIKASNILLDKNLHPKISDFGLSKFFDMEKGFTSTKVAGTFGYMAPEYVTRGRLTSKADVFSYGVLVLEIVSGRRCVDSTMPPGEDLLVPHIWKVCEAGKLDKCVDPRLDDRYVPDEVARMIHIALLCTQDNENARPTMSILVTMLQGFLELPRVPDQAPSYSIQQLDQNSTTNHTISSFLPR